ncbi:hypothetical protein SNEBB_003801 [Seison nebaliae]|nr:hypothetical protein SNEBB_003801 [Seison nebaliae]
MSSSKMKFRDVDDDNVSETNEVNEDNPFYENTEKTQAPSQDDAAYFEFTDIPVDMGNHSRNGGMCGREKMFDLEKKVNDKIQDRTDRKFECDMEYEETKKNKNVDQENNRFGYEEKKKFHEEREECAYCGYDDDMCIGKCLSSGRWFCNRMSRNGSCSHIVYHLIRSGFKRVQLHPTGPLAGIELQCYYCGNDNVFTLGYIPAKRESFVIILCRTNCPQQVIEEADWDSHEWEPLIKERRFLPWILKESKKLSSVNNDNLPMITRNQMDKMEQKWRLERDMQETSEYDEKNIPQLEQLRHMEAKYANIEEYCKIFQALLTVEADEDRRRKESMKQTKVNVRWERGLNKKLYVYFELSLATDDVRLFVGDEVKLVRSIPIEKDENDKSISRLTADLSTLIPFSTDRTRIETEDGRSKFNHGHLTSGGKQSSKKQKQHGDPNELTGYITRVPTPFSNEFQVQLSGDKLQTDIVDVELVWNKTPFKRMQEALKELEGIMNKQLPTSTTSLRAALQRGHLILLKKLLGQISFTQQTSYLTSLLQKHNNVKNNSKGNYSIKGLPQLNPSQIAAVKDALNNDCTLIQGPPGTGKTSTSSTIVYHLFQETKQQLLVCASSNCAVDQLADKIYSTGLKVVRVYSKAREALPTIDCPYALHMKVKSETNNEKLAKLQKLKDEFGELTVDDEKEYITMRFAAESRILRDANVICCTCIGAFDPRLSGMNFPIVLIDESTQAGEIQCMIPITKGCGKLILVGDYCQLGPIVLSTHAAAAGLNSSLFERLLVLGAKPIRLQVQYRMHPFLSKFPSNTFYEGSLQNGVTESERTLDVLAKGSFTWPVEHIPTFFYCCNGQEEISATGKSCLNRMEATYVRNIVVRLLRCGLNPEQIGIMTPYEGQRSFLFQHIHHSGEISVEHCGELEISSVDAFQGREKDFIILSCVRSNVKQGIGFLKDPRRLNVAITRAKYGLIIIGNAKLLSEDNIWNHLLHFYQNENLLVEGPLNQLKKSKIILHQLAPLKNPINPGYHFAFKNFSRSNADGDGNGRNGKNDESIANSQMLIMMMMNDRQQQQQQQQESQQGNDQSNMSNQGTFANDRDIPLSIPKFLPGRYSQFGSTSNNYGSDMITQSSMNMQMPMSNSNVHYPPSLQQPPPSHSNHQDNSYEMTQTNGVDKRNPVNQIYYENKDSRCVSSEEFSQSNNKNNYNNSVRYVQNRNRNQQPSHPIMERYPVPFNLFVPPTIDQSQVHSMGDNHSHQQSNNFTDHLSSQSQTQLTQFGNEEGSQMLYTQHPGQLSDQRNYQFSQQMPQSQLTTETMHSQLSFPDGNFSQFPENDRHL